MLKKLLSSFHLNSHTLGIYLQSWNCLAQHKEQYHSLLQQRQLLKDLFLNIIIIVLSVFGHFMEILRCLYEF